MATRKIIIEICDQCPHRTHSGGFTPGGAFPLCGITKAPEDQRMVDYRGNRRILPWETGHGRDGRAFRSYTGEIPGWCPLPIN